MKKYQQWDTNCYNQYLERFQLPKKKKLKEFSKGMKMKLSIAVALSHKPKLLILDEATSGLDPVMRDEILEIFLDFMQDETHGILLSSHITGDLEKIADYITFIHQGKLIFSKPKDELIYQYGVIRCGREEFEKLEKEEIIAYQKTEYQWNVLVADIKKIKAKYKELIVDQVTIDEIMLLYIKGGNK